jgi:four helix bundle protein
MGVRRLQDLVAWRLSYELRREVFALTAAGAVARDVSFCEQIRDASASAPRNIAEGFGRYAPLEFARFLQMARGSLVETEHHLLDGRDRGYFDPQVSARPSNLARAAVRATTHLLLAQRRRAGRT